VAEGDVDLIRSVYEAFQRRDVGGVVEHLDADVVWHQSDLLPWGGTYRGPEQAMVYARRFIEHVESELHPATVFDAGDRVVMFGRTTGRARRSGSDFDVPSVHVWQVRDGRIVRFEAYTDTRALLRALAT
jgi:uncharacterized protein